MLSESLRRNILHFQVIDETDLYPPFNRNVPKNYESSEDSFAKLRRAVATGEKVLAMGLQSSKLDTRSEDPLCMWALNSGSSKVKCSSTGVTWNSEVAAAGSGAVLVT
ncbi:hypothetical protein AVEN_175218-1 [Araneus ventricosus]|uniref:Uncharacterized protein n=1 Tax=Araneus ventricosus TaxID=182803 RepID=A0A4Y2SP02_ARAVE|nr:hypothetical protein AVEN_175218-1 [Araneus ventricosus]